MIPNSLSRFPPPPDTTLPKPRMWKNLGAIARSNEGFIEAHYELKNFRGDLDIDSEDDVKAAMTSLLDALSNSGTAIDSANVYALQRRRGLLRVRLAVGYWNEPTTVAGIM